MDLNASQKHPLILHHKDYPSLLIGRQTHLDGMHIEPTGMMGILSTTYSILGAKALVRKISKECVN